MFSLMDPTHEMPARKHIVEIVSTFVFWVYINVDEAVKYTGASQKFHTLVLVW